MAIERISCLKSRRVQIRMQLVLTRKTVTIGDAEWSGGMFIKSSKPKAFPALNQHNIFHYNMSNIDAPHLFIDHSSFVMACVQKVDDFSVEDLSQLHQWRLWQNWIDVERWSAFITRTEMLQRLRSSPSALRKLMSLSSNVPLILFNPEDGGSANWK